MAKSTMLFDVLDNILRAKSIELAKQHIASESFKDAAPFMVRRYLTMSSNASVRQVVFDHFMSLERMPADVQYLWLLKAVPKQSSGFIRYLK